MEINDAIRKECLRRRYSEKTIKTYITCVNLFFKKCKKEPKKVTKKDVREFLENLAEKGRAGNTLNVYLNALKFVFEDLLGKRMRLNIRYSKRPMELPTVLTREEVKELFNAITNEKHRLMIMLIYSSGLRVNELINLKVKDLNINKGYGFVRKGKGNKDRLFIIADKIKEKLNKLVVNEKLKEADFLFNSNRKSCFHTRTIQEIIKKAAKKAKIKKNVHPHTLRHSFATHLIENKYSISEVQGLLGHNNPETTMIYLHTANINMINVKSPLDSFSTK